MVWYPPICKTSPVHRFLSPQHYLSKHLCNNVYLLILRNRPLLVFGPEGPSAKLFVRQIPSIEVFSPGSAFTRSWKMTRRKVNGNPQMMIWQGVHEEEIHLAVGEFPESLLFLVGQVLKLLGQQFAPLLCPFAEVQRSARNNMTF